MYPERFCRKIYAGQEVSSASVAVVKNTGKQELSKVSSVHSREQHSTHHCSPRHHRDTSQFVATTNSNKQPASHTDRVSSDPFARLLPLNFFLCNSTLLGRFVGVNTLHAHILARRQSRKTFQLGWTTHSRLILLPPEPCVCGVVLIQTSSVELQRQQCFVGNQHSHTCL